jgi:hypothetical protein
MPKQPGASTQAAWHSSMSPGATVTVVKSAMPFGSVWQHPTSRSQHGCAEGVVSGVGCSWTATGDEVVGEPVGEVVGDDVVGEPVGDVVGDDVVGEVVGEATGASVQAQHTPQDALLVVWWNCEVYLYIRQLPSGRNSIPVQI